MLVETGELVDIDAEILESKRVLAQLMSEKEDLLRANKLSYFVSNPGGQTKFFERAESRGRAVMSGNRFGKSTAGVVEDCCWLLGYRPFYPEGHPLRYAGIPAYGVKGLCIAETWDKVDDIFTKQGDPTNEDRIGKFFTFLPAGSVSNTTKNQHGVISSIEVTSYLRGKKRVSILVFDTVSSYLTKPMSKESSDWDFIHADEPLPKGFWEAVSRGLIDRSGKWWWLMTPKTEPWMYHQVKRLASENPDMYWMYTGDTDENLVLSEEDKHEYFRNLSEEDLRCRKEGKPVALSRMVISNFREDRHILEGTPKGWKDPLTPPPEYMVCVATDTHPQTPHATLCVALSPPTEGAPQGAIFIFEEKFEKGSVRAIAEWIKGKPYFSQIMYYLLEPAAFVEDQDTGRCYADNFFEAGLEPQKGTKKRAEAIVYFNALFAQKDRPVYVLGHLKWFLFEVQSWYFDKDNKPIDKDDHMMENFGRLLSFDNLVYRKPYGLSPIINNVRMFDSSLNVFGELKEPMHLSAV